MPNFSYKAKDKSGNTVSGVVDAADLHMAAGMVREMGYTPLSIESAKNAVQKDDFNLGFVLARHLVYPLWTGVNIRSLALFFRQMATLLNSGMAVAESLRSAGTRTGGRLGRIVADMLSSVQMGGKLSDAMEKHFFVFGTLPVSMVRAGEASGMLSQMVDRIASYLEYEITVRRMIAKVLFYPIFIFAFIVLTIFIMSHLNVISGAVTGKAAAVDPVFALAWHVTVIVIYCIPIAVVVLKLLFQFELPRIIWDTIKMVPPVIGTTAHKIAMSRFCRAFSLLYSAGISMGEAVLVASDACANRALGRRIKNAVPGINNGAGVTETLIKTHAFLPMVVDMLTTGEKTGSFDSVMEKVSDYMEEEADTTIHKLGIVIFVASILLAAIIVVFILVHFYSGYFGQMMETGG